MKKFFLTCLVTAFVFGSFGSMNVTAASNPEARVYASGSLYLGAPTSSFSVREVWRWIPISHEDFPQWFGEWRTTLSVTQNEVQVRATSARTQGRASATSLTGTTTGQWQNQNVSSIAIRPATPTGNRANWAFRDQ